MLFKRVPFVNVGDKNRNEEENSIVLSSILETLESITLFLAIFDLFEIALVTFSLSSLMLLFDLKMNLISKEENLVEMFKKYFSFPLLFLAFSFIFPLGESGKKFLIIISSYAFLRVLYTFLKASLQKKQPS